jgi:hypothetical protein
MIWLMGGSSSDALTPFPIVLVGLIAFAIGFFAFRFRGAWVRRLIDGRPHLLRESFLGQVLATVLPGFVTAMTFVVMAYGAILCVAGIVFAILEALNSAN